MSRAQLVMGIEPANNIVFCISTATPTEVLRVEPDGRFFVRGEEVETPEEVRDIFAAWCKFMMEAA